MKSAVVVFPGSNCDRDCAVAIERSVGGPAPTMVWHGETELAEDLDLIVLPGGFAYGDYLRAGAMAADSSGSDHGPSRPSPVTWAIRRIASPRQRIMRWLTPSDRRRPPGLQALSSTSGRLRPSRPTGGHPIRATTVPAR